MATQIQYRHTNTTDTLYMVIVRDTDGAHMNTSDGTADTSPTSGEWGNYDISMTEDSDSRLYQATFTSTISAGVYSVLIFKRAGGSVVVGDSMVAAPLGVFWDGSNIIQGATTVMTELSSIPAKDANLHQQIQLIFMWIRNKLTSTSNVQTIFNDAGTAIGTNTISDTAGKFTKEKFS